MSTAQRVLYALLAIAAVYTAIVLLERRTPMAARSAAPPPYRDPVGLDRIHSVTILNFYASPGVLTEGESATLCYGVALAEQVRLDPPVEALTPSLNRCISVRPEQDTRYTLTAEGAGGTRASESFLIEVKPDPLLLPRVVLFLAQKKAEDRGQPVYSLCFQVENAERVRLEPPLIPPMYGSPKGCFYAAPQQTTTYTLIAEGRHQREARRQVKVAIP